ncbi:MAG: hypothetical protein MUF34_14080 [Polyangiaceae bacterium]|nr:hypothetical protein [Polyangiaceae bacterium]
MHQRVYRSCGCRRCRHVPTSTKVWHKQRAHRLFRRRCKAMLLRGDDSTPIVSTGYRD